MLKYDFDLTLSSEYQIFFNKYANAITSINLIAVGEWLIYVLTDNTEYIKVIVAYSNKVFELNQFKPLISSNESIITQINDLITGECSYGSSENQFFDCYISLVYEYLDNDKSITANSTHPLHIKSSQNSYSKLFKINMYGKYDLSGNLSVGYDAYNFYDKIEGRKFKRLILDENLLYIAGSYSKKGSINS